MRAFQEVEIDFEFHNTTHRYVKLVCAVSKDAHTGKIKRWWLHNKKSKQAALRKYLSRYKKITCYSAVAEGRSFLSLGLDPFTFKWWDGFVEYRMLTNHNDEFLYGKQLVNGRVKFTKKPPPKWERTEEDNFSGFKPTHSLAEATYKLLGIKRDTKHKDQMRDLIISGPKRFSKKERIAIMDYCEEDVLSLGRIKRKIIKHNLRLNPEVNRKTYMRGAWERGDYQAATAHMESRGYPINVMAVKNFSAQVGSILFETQREVNKYFPKIRPFRWNKKENRFSWNQGVTKDWIRRKHNNGKNWMRTKGKDLSLSLDAWQRHYDYKHDYPKNVFGAQMVRFLKLKQNLYGFSSDNESSSRKNFWDAVGPDGMVRPYLNSFAAQSSRTQPGATSFMFLKPAWMRAMVEPPEGYFMAGIDYSAVEFFISALKSGDMNMINAYLSGDPYFYFAKLAGAVPKDAVRKDYEDVRNLFKSTILGLSYNMSCIGLAAKLTLDTGKKWTEEAAQVMIDQFYDVFWKLKDWQDEQRANYESGNPIVLEDGWTMWCDNDNWRSAGNCPVQGTGAVILRRAIRAAMKKGVYIPFPLHDAAYMMAKIGNEHEIIILRDCMREAFVSVFEGPMREHAKKVRLDIKAWSPNYKMGKIKYTEDKKPYYEDGEVMFVGKEKLKVKCNRLHIDERALAEYEKFSKYFEGRKEDLL